MFKINWTIPKGSYCGDSVHVYSCDAVVDAEILVLATSELNFSDRAIR